MSNLLWGIECWTLKLRQEKREGITKFSMLRWMCIQARKDKIWNYCMHGDIDAVPIEEKMTKNQLGWFLHVQRLLNALTRRVNCMVLWHVKRGRRSRRT